MGSAASGAEAVEQCRKLRPDVVTMDFNMPGMNGVELLRALRAADAMLPAIVVTGHGDVPMAVEAMRLGAQDYVLKDELCPEMLLPIVDGLRERLQLRGGVEGHEPALGHALADENVDAAECFLESKRCLRLESGDEAIHELLRRQVEHSALGACIARPCDGLQQMGFAETDAAGRAQLPKPRFQPIERAPRGRILSGGGSRHQDGGPDRGRATKSQHRHDQATPEVAEIAPAYPASP